MNARRPRIATMLMTLLLAGGAGADVVHLADGSAVEGTVKRNGDGYDVTDSAGKVTHVLAENVKGIDIGSKVLGPAEAESRLLSLRRAVENSTDIKSIIERYARFIEQNRESAVVRDAENDAAVWRDRLAKGMVKVGANWVTAAEREQMQSRGLEIAEQARQLLRQGRLRDADPLVQQVLDADPANAAALYLRGTILFRQDQFPAARKSFEGVLASVKDHPATLNNLAVVVWRQNQQLLAMNYYVQAMTALPLSREILNNVAEALNALPQGQRGSPMAQKCFKLFSEQDTALQDAMARQGWYRWGSTWVDKAQIERLQQIEKDVQKKLDAMSADYDEIKKKVGRIEDDIDDNVRRMRAMEDTSYARDAQGNIYWVPLPRRYYDLQADNKKLAADRAALVAKLEELRAGARQVQQQIPTPRFTGAQQLIGLEGTPLLPPMQNAAMAVGAAARGDLLPPRDVIPVEAYPSTQPAGPASRPAATQPTTWPAVRQPIPESLLSPG